MYFMNILISLISGAVGGNVAGAALKKYSLGTLGNSIAGILGGGLGGAILNNYLISPDSGAGILANVAGSGIGGAVIMLIVGAIRQAFIKKDVSTTASKGFSKDADRFDSQVKKPTPKSSDLDQRPPL